MKECGYKQGHNAVKHFSVVYEFCLTEKVPHQNGKHRVSRYRCEHSQHSCSHTILEDVKEIFKSGKSHSDHDGIYNSIKRLVEVSVPIQHKPDKNEFTKLFN